MLLLLLDYQPLTLPDDVMATIFIDSQWQNESTPNCTMNPMSGTRMSSDLLSTDWGSLPEPNWQNFSSPISVTGNENMMTPMVFVPPGGNPLPLIPDPPTPFVPATPEPSTVAILGITAAVLMALLFGRRYRRKPSRYL